MDTYAPSTAAKTAVGILHATVQHALSSSPPGTLLKGLGAGQSARPRRTRSSGSAASPPPPVDDGAKKVDIGETIVEGIVGVLSVGLYEGLTFWDAVQLLGGLPDQVDVFLAPGQQAQMHAMDTNASAAAPTGNKLLDDLQDLALHARKVHVSRYTTNANVMKQARADAADEGEVGASCELPSDSARHPVSAKGILGALRLVKTGAPMANGQKRARAFVRCLLNQRLLMPVLELLAGMPEATQGLYHSDASVFTAPEESGLFKLFLAAVLPIAGPPLRSRAAASLFDVPADQLASGAINAGDARTAIEESPVARAAETAAASAGMLEENGMLDHEAAMAAIAVQCAIVADGRRALIDFTDSFANAGLSLLRFGLALGLEDDDASGPSSSTTPVKANPTASATGAGAGYRASPSTPPPVHGAGLGAGGSGYGASTSTPAGAGEITVQRRTRTKTQLKNGGAPVVTRKRGDTLKGQSGALGAAALATGGVPIASRPPLPGRLSPMPDTASAGPSPSLSAAERQGSHGSEFGHAPHAVGGGYGASLSQGGGGSASVSGRVTPSGNSKNSSFVPAPHHPTMPSTYGGLHADPNSTSRFSDRSGGASPQMEGSGVLEAPGNAHSGLLPPLGAPPAPGSHGAGYSSQSSYHTQPHHTENGSLHHASPSPQYASGGSTGHRNGAVNTTNAAALQFDEAEKIALQAVAEQRARQDAEIAEVNRFVASKGAREKAVVDAADAVVQRYVQMLEVQFAKMEACMQAREVDIMTVLDKDAGT